MIGDPLIPGERYIIEKIGDRSSLYQHRYFLIGKECRFIGSFRDISPAALGVSSGVYVELPLDESEIPFAYASVRINVTKIPEDSTSLAKTLRHQNASTPPLTTGHYLVQCRDTVLGEVVKPFLDIDYDRYDQGEIVI